VSYEWQPRSRFPPALTSQRVVPSRRCLELWLGGHGTVPKKPATTLNGLTIILRARQYVSLFETRNVNPLVEAFNSDKPLNTIIRNLLNHEFAFIVVGLVNKLAGPDGRVTLSKGSAYQIFLRP
jgi:hypothetical protein